MQKIRTIIKTPYEISDPEALWIDTSNADSPTLKVHEQGTWKSLGTSDGGSATPDNGILTVDGRHWAMADKDGSGPYTKAEAMQRLGWTEEQFDAVLSEPSPNELPKPCAVFYYGYFFPKYVTVYGTFAAQAVLDTIEDNGNRLTAVQIVSILRGTDLTEDLVFGRFTGKYRLLQKSEISEVIDSLERFDVIRKRSVHGQYQNYYVYSVSQKGRLFSELQSTPVPRRSPVTEQEYYLALRAVRDDFGRITDRKKLELLRAIAEKPGIFLTDPGLILDCVELMGKTAEGYLKGCYAEEDRRTRRDILRLLVNAASGKGKVLPKNGLTEFRKREEKKRKEKEESERRDRELFQLVLTEIPDNYVDLYPAARSMSRKRHQIFSTPP